jgi:hypothetical protein
MASRPLPLGGPRAFVHFGLVLIDDIIDQGIQRHGYLKIIIVS